MRCITTVAAAVLSASILFSCDEEVGNPSGRTQAKSGDIITIAGKDGDFLYRDSVKATDAMLSWVVDIAIDESGSLYLADGACNVIRKIVDGNITTVAGKFRGLNQLAADVAPDGTEALDAILDGTFLVDLDASGRIYFSETARSLLREVVDDKVKTIAGMISSTEFQGDGEPATETGMWAPQGLAVDRATGAIYYSDTQNNAVRKIVDGIVTTVAGLGRDNAGYSGDGGPATEARLDYPQGIAIDAVGNLYISDAGNHVIRKVSHGVITTIAGTGQEGSNGDGGPATEAQIYGAHGIAVDPEGNVYITDGNRIRMITASTGIISTVAGNGMAGFSGDNGPATEARLYDPWDVAVDAEGNIYIADSGNSRIRMVVK